MQKNWEDLANAIVLQGIEDYRAARRRLRRGRKKKRKKAIIQARKTIRRVERFCRSKWFSQLTDIDGERLIRQLKEERIR